MLDVKVSFEYPVRVLHRGHLAFRAKTTSGKELIMPDGREHNHAEYHWSCGICKAVPTPLSIIAGDWKVDYEVA